MGTTSGLALPYPEGTDPVALGDDAMKALAQAMDALYSRAPETANVANGVVASAGWTVGVARLARWGPFRSIWVVVSRSGAALPVASAAGEIVDSPMLSGLPAPYRPAGGAVQMPFGNDNSPGGTALLSITGTLTLVSYAPSSIVTTGLQMRGSLVYDVQVGV